ncbi:hypothetical protein [Salinibacterium sp. ZJ70]|uniref:hypothetical protein n=1 Tax=Salinibacterium sp. ZJ70 TaxID=2708084 RepID=UPI00141D9D55|nr:hypothetical protein [Salinibacterium sp. ZJ70]
MSGTRIRLDYESLQELSKNLKFVVDVMSRDTEMGIGVGGVVGRADLAGAANSFRDSWDKRRLELRDQFEWLQESVENIATQFATVDKDLASGLSQGSGNAPSGQKAV